MDLTALLAGREVDLEAELVVVDEDGSRAGGGIDGRYLV
jgi:hypothetical protein